MLHIHVFAGKGKTKNWGEFIFGFAFLFMGLNMLSASAESLNIGTTITAFLAALTANTQAKRAAVAHMFFNVFGVIVVLCGARRRTPRGSVAL